MIANPDSHADPDKRTLSATQASRITSAIAALPPDSRRVVTRFLVGMVDPADRADYSLLGLSARSVPHVLPPGRGLFVDGAVETRLTSPRFAQLIESRDAQFGALAGVAFGVVLLNERLSASFIAAALMVAVGPLLSPLQRRIGKPRLPGNLQGIGTSRFAYVQDVERLKVLAVEPHGRIAYTLPLAGE